MIYILNKEYRLRGYKRIPTGLLDLRRMDTRFYGKELYRILLNCDGIHDFKPEELTDEQKSFLQQLIDEKYVHEAVFGEMLSPEQIYKLYPTEYRQSCQWSITGECNFNCRHCFMSAPEGKHGSPSWEQLLNIADQLAECGVHKVGITGGEPLIRGDFLKLLDLLFEREIGVSVIYTNGWLVDEKLLDALGELGMRPAFQLSFDGVGQHDFLRGVKGAEEQTIKALKLLQERNYSVSVSMCLHKNNIGTVRETVKLLAGLGVRSLKTSSGMELGEWTSPDVKALYLSNDEILKAICEYIPEYFEDEAPLSIMHCGHFVYNRGDAGWSLYDEVSCSEADEGIMPNCGVLRSSFFISASGRVAPCMTMDDSDFAENFPNLFEKPLKDILADPTFKNLTTITVKEVRDANPKCRKCGFVDRCIGGCRSSALMASGDYKGIDHEMCEFFEKGWDKKIRAVADPAFQAYLKRHPEIKKSGKAVASENDRMGEFC